MSSDHLRSDADPATAHTHEHGGSRGPDHNEASHPRPEHHEHTATSGHDHGAPAPDHGTHDDHAGHTGHGGHAGHGDHVAMFRRLFWVMLALAVPVVAADMMFADLIGYTVPTGLQWVSPALGTVMFFWGGRPFLTGAVSEIRSRQPGMMLLIALAITVAFAASWGSTLGLLAHELDFWWELALLIVIMLLGHWIEMRSLGQASSALESLAALLPDEAERLGEDGTTATVPVTDLRTGDLVVGGGGGGGAGGGARGAGPAPPGRRGGAGGGGGCPAGLRRRPGRARPRPPPAPPPPPPPPPPPRPGRRCAGQ